MVSVVVTSINNLQRNGRTASDAVVIGIEAARRQLIALTAGTSAVRLPGTIQATLEELLIDSAIIDARASRPLPSVLPAVTGASLKAIVLRQTEY